MSKMNYPQKETTSESAKNDDVLEYADDSDESIENAENIEADPMISEEEFKEQYQKLPMWQHVILAILFLFGMTAVIMVIDFAVEFFIELMKHIF